MKLAIRAVLPTVVLATIVSASCLRASSPPAYMQDVPRTGEEKKVAVAEIDKELGDGFIVEQVANIFFVAGDGGRWQFDNCKAVVNRMYTFLTTQYFTTKPDKPIRVYCFNTKEAYEAYVQKSLGRKPSTPFGFYLSGERKMVMNISTGTGTLAHELVHPLLGEDFPGVPSWFNEGFASLFEQSDTKRDGTIVGKPNWRLPGLQRALKKDELMPLEDVLKTTSTEFYSDTTGLHYAVARYLCYWLQEKGLLLKFYKAWKESRKDDANGIATLEKVTGVKLAEFEKTWREFVREIEYER